jgi:hypothetical protein
MNTVILVLLKYIGAMMIKKMLIKWMFEAVFDAMIEYAEKMARRTDTEIDDDAVAKFKSNKATFIKYAKGKL